MELPWVPKEKGLLTQLIAQSSKPPGVIALQEPGTRPTLHGYEEYHASQDDKWKVATLVDKNITTIQHKSIHDVDVQHVLLEFVYKGNQRKSAFVLNVYCPPAKGGQTLANSSGTRSASPKTALW